MKTDKKEFGFLGEETAGRLFLLKGYKILERNYRCRFGEIDLICENDEGLAFVEVKTRRDLAWGSPAEAVDREKQRRIKKSALFYMRDRIGKAEDFSFHVVEVCINHIENVF